MAKQIINIGSAPGAGDGECIRDAFIKINLNFDEVYALANKEDGMIRSDMIGSVFADDSTTLVDGTNASIVGVVNNSDVTTRSLSIANNNDTNIARLVPNTNNIDLDFNIENSLNLNVENNVDVSINNGGITLVSDINNDIALTLNSFNITGDVVVNTNMFNIDVSTGDVSIQNGAIEIDNSQEVNINNAVTVDASQNVIINNAITVDVSQNVNINNALTIDASQNVNINNSLTIDNSQNVNINNALTIDASQNVVINNAITVDASQNVNINNAVTIDASQEVNINNAVNIDASQNVNINNALTIDASQNVVINNAVTIDASQNVNINNAITVDVDQEVNINNALTIDNSNNINIGINNSISIDASQNITFAPSTNIDFTNINTMNLDINLVNQVDVDFNTITNNQILIYNSTSGNFEAGVLSINDLSDVDTETSAPTAGQVLKWDGSNWTPANDIDTTLSLATASIKDLGDVNSDMTPSGGEYLVYDSGNNRWTTGSVYVPTSFYDLNYTPNYSEADDNDGAILRVDGSNGDLVFEHHTKMSVNSGGSLIAEDTWGYGNFKQGINDVLWTNSSTLTFRMENDSDWYDRINNIREGDTIQIWFSGAWNEVTVTGPVTTWYVNSASYDYTIPIDLNGLNWNIYRFKLARKFDTLREGVISTNLYSNDSSILYDSSTGEFHGTLRGDVIGSLYSDDSTQILDGVSGEFLGNVAYTPDNNTYWNDPKPTTVAEALNRMAEAIYVANGGSAF